LRLILVFAVPLIALACDKGRGGKRSADDTACDTGPAVDTDLDCDTGQLDDDGDCVPAVCGIGTWGNLEVDESTIYVDIVAAEGGDGSEAAPFTSIQAGLDAAGDADGGLVAVAAGTYPETLELGRSHGDVHLAGRCKELIVIDASVGTESSAGIEVEVRSSRVEVSGVTVSGALAAGVRVESGTLTIRNAKVVDGESYGFGAFQGGLYPTTIVAEACELLGNTSVGVLAYDAGTTLTLRETTIQDTRSDENEVGWGIDVYDGASLTAEACTLSGNSGAGIIAVGSDTEVTLRETSIQGTHADGNGDGGFGIDVYGGTSVVAESCTISENMGVGVIVDGAGTQAALRETTIRDTQPNGAGKSGYGIQVSDAASLIAEYCDVARNAGDGILVVEPDTSVALLGTTIRDTRPDENGEGGDGIQVSTGASLDAEGCEVRGNTGSGVLVGGSGTSVTLRETVIEGTLSGESREYGYGISVQDGASLEAEGCEVRRNTALGVGASDPGTSVTLQDSRITSTMRGEFYTVGVGLGLDSDASLVAAGIDVSSNEGPGIYVVNEDTQLVCSDCTIRDNQFAGAVVANGASFQLAESLIEGTTEQENIGGGVGVYAWPWGGGPPTLEVTGTTIRNNPIAGVWVSGQGSYSLSGNAIHGGEGWTREGMTKCGDAVYAREGVTAWDGSSGLLLENNELLDGLDAGLFLDNASATLSGNSYADNAVDIVRQGADCAAPPDGYENEAIGSAELCPDYDYANCGDEFWLYMTLEEPEMGYDAALMSPGLTGSDDLRFPGLPVALPYALDPLPLLAAAPRLEPLEIHPQPLRRERPPHVPLDEPRAQ